MAGPNTAVKILAFTDSVTILSRRGSRLQVYSSQRVCP
jgi:hypothetical protein